MQNLSFKLPMTNMKHLISIEHNTGLLYSKASCPHNVKHCHCTAERNDICNFKTLLWHYHNHKQLKPKHESLQHVHVNTELIFPILQKQLW